MFKFSISHKIPGALGRRGTYTTPHGDIQTPCFDVVGTKATVKGLTNDMLRSMGTQVFLANTYHLHLDPGEDRIAELGGLHSFTGWQGPMVTDSGGFQAFSLGAAFGTSVSKISEDTGAAKQTALNQNKEAKAKISEEGVTFRSHKNGDELFFSPEKSVQIQQKLGADIYFVLDECISPQADENYQKQAIERTHRWAERCLVEHKRLETVKTDKPPQALFGIVQGGRNHDLREYSAKHIGAMDFDGFGIGGALIKADMNAAVIKTCQILPEHKPRHLLGIGEVEDILLGVENGIDMFDCVAPTRMARHGNVHTLDGKINLLRAQFRNDAAAIDESCNCYTCANHTRAYVAHLLREGELLGATLASIHNLHFLMRMMERIRLSIEEGTFAELKKEILDRYYKN